MKWFALVDIVVSMIKKERGKKMDTREKTYLQGLIDAWELARTIALPPTRGGMGYNDLVECFNIARNDVFCLPVSEVKEKYDKWKAEIE